VKRFSHGILHGHGIWSLGEIEAVGFHPINYFDVLFLNLYLFILKIIMSTHPAKRKTV